MRTSRLRRSGLAAVVAGVVLALLGSPASAITWGAPDGEKHPEVVTLLFQQPTDWYSCSGTLLSPTLVLTAGHCTEYEGVENTQTWVSNHPDPLAKLAAGQSLPSFLKSRASTFVQAKDVVPHPEYADFAAFPDTFDIGLVKLPTRTSVLAPVKRYGTLPPRDFLTTMLKPLGPLHERRVTVVGYGLQSTLPAQFQDDYVRHRGTSAVMGFGSSALQGTQTVQLTNTPGAATGGGGTCFGDSGGPAFWIDDKGVETSMVVAITSYGITGHCVGTDFSFRTDTAVAQDFVQRYR